MPAPSPPTRVYPVCEQLLQVGLETGGFAVAPASTAFASVPVVSFTPDNKVTWVEDGSMWGDFVKTHDVQEGPVWAESDIKESPLYGDTFGHFLYNLMGDLVETGNREHPDVDDLRRAVGRRRADRGHVRVGAPSPGPTSRSTPGSTPRSSRSAPGPRPRASCWTRRRRCGSPT